MISRWMAHRQFYRVRRNIGQVTLKIHQLYYKKEYFLGDSIPKDMLFCLENKIAAHRALSRSFLRAAMLVSADSRASEAERFAPSSAVSSSETRNFSAAVSPTSTSRAELTDANSSRTADNVSATSSLSLFCSSATVSLSCSACAASSQHRTCHQDFGHEHDAACIDQHFKIKHKVCWITCSPIISLRLGT